jgi:hypothetical protein
LIFVFRKNKAIQAKTKEPTTCPLVVRIRPFDPRKTLLYGLFVCVPLLVGTISAAADDTPTAATNAFYPTWKLLNQAEKQHFVSGYKFASEDMHRVLEIVAKFIKENPDQAVEGINSLKRVFNYASVNPDRLAIELDAYFANSENQKASLSKAISAAKQRM